MSNVEFRPSTWAKAATEVGSEASSFQSDATGTVAGMSLAELGCNEGGTLADTALAMIFPPLFSAINETVAGLSKGLLEESSMMSVTGLTYEATEATNESAASSMPTGGQS